jgi:hypothetical protein
MAAHDDDAMPTLDDLIEPSAAGLAAAGLPASLFLTEDDAFVPTVLTTSPWGEDSLHGGPVAALLADALESMPTAVPMFPARFTIELLRPVGLEPMTIETRVVRGGKKVQVLEALLSPVRAPDEPAARATLQQVVAAGVDLPDGALAANGPERDRPPAPENCPRQTGAFAPRENVRFHNTAVEHRSPETLFVVDGPAVDWIRVIPDLLPDRPLSPFARVVAAADFGNGISRVLPFPGYLFVNPDLTVHLYRLPVDEYVCLDAITRLDPSPGAGSVGFAESALFDRLGRIGRSAQSLLIAKT